MHHLTAKERAARRFLLTMTAKNRGLSEASMALLRDRLEEQLQLNSEQRQAVLEQICLNGKEDPALIAPILNETQREGYQSSGK